MMIARILFVLLAFPGVSVARQSSLRREGSIIPSERDHERLMNLFYKSSSPPRSDSNSESRSNSLKNKSSRASRPPSASPSATLPPTCTTGSPTTETSKSSNKTMSTSKSKSSTGPTMKTSKSTSGSKSTSKDSSAASKSNKSTSKSKSSTSPKTSKSMTGSKSTSKASSPASKSTSKSKSSTSPKTSKSMSGSKSTSKASSPASKSTSKSKSSTSPKTSKSMSGSKSTSKASSTASKSKSSTISSMKTSKSMSGSKSTSKASSAASKSNKSASKSKSSTSSKTSKSMFSSKSNSEDSSKAPNSKKSSPTSNPTSNPTSTTTNDPTNHSLCNDSPVPTAPPTLTECLLDVEIDCKLENGLSCDAKASPDGICAIGNELYVVAFSYHPDCNCSESKNMQDGVAACEDLSPLGDAPASVRCIDRSNSSELEVEPSVVAPGETFTIKNNHTQGELPARIECALISTETGAIVQINAIDVSGDVTLNLKDKFGALQLETCDEQVCIEEAWFEYLLVNVGNGDMSMTAVKRTADDGSEVELVDQVSPNPLAPGEGSTIGENIYIDYCRSAVEIVKVYAEGNSPLGKVCVDEDKFAITINTTPRPSSTPPTPSTTPSPTPSSPPAIPPIPQPTRPPTRPPSFPPTPPPNRPLTPPPSSLQSPLPTTSSPTLSPSAGIPPQCETAMVYCGNVDGPDREEWCGQNDLPQRWGWTNRIGTSLTCIIGAAKGGCDESNGFDAGFITIDQANKSFTVFLYTGVSMTEYHIKTTEGFQVVDNKFGNYPNTGDEVSSGQIIDLSDDSPFEDEDWFTFHSVVCRSNGPIPV